MKTKVIKKKKGEGDKKREKFKEEVIHLVIARLRTIPPRASLSIGDKEALSVEEMIEHVQRGDEMGELIIETQLEHIRSLKDLPVTFEEDEYPDN
ncbi:MAG: hypothetical protein ACKKMO_02170 [Candidatus Nealsonbacteria bacterium]